MTASLTRGVCVTSVSSIDRDRVIERTLRQSLSGVALPMGLHKEGS